MCNNILYKRFRLKSTDMQEPECYNYHLRVHLNEPEPEYLFNLLAYKGGRNSQ